MVAQSKARHNNGRPWEKEAEALATEFLKERMRLFKVQEAITRAPRSEAVITRGGKERTYRFGASVAAMVRQLLAWEGKGHAEDNWIHKSEFEWMQADAGLTAARLRTARRIGVEEGLWREEVRLRPSDGRMVVYYRLDAWRVARVVVASELETVRALMQRERRPAQLAELEERLRELEAQAALMDRVGRREPGPEDPSEDPAGDAREDTLDQRFTGANLTGVGCQSSTRQGSKKRYYREQPQSNDDREAALSQSAYLSEGSESPPGGSRPREESQDLSSVKDGAESAAAVGDAAGEQEGQREEERPKGRSKRHRTKDLFTLFCGMVEASGMEVTPEDRRSVPANLKRLGERLRAQPVGVTAAEVIGRMVEARRERNHALSPQAALEDALKERRGVSRWEGRRGDLAPTRLGRTTKTTFDNEPYPLPPGRIERRTKTVWDEDDIIGAPPRDPSAGSSGGDRMAPGRIERRSEVDVRRPGDTW
jgi:hypothetical protein